MSVSRNAQSFDMCGVTRVAVGIVSVAFIYSSLFVTL